MITILARDDLVGVFLITGGSDPWSFAEQLGSCHLFHVKVKVTIDGDLNELLNALEDCHIQNQWFKCSLQHIVGVWAKLTDEPLDEYMDIEPTASGSSEASQPLQSTDSLPACLLHCAADKAPLAKQLREDLIRLLGKAEANTIVDKLSAKTARLNGKPARIFFYQDTPVALNT